MAVDAVTYVMAIKRSAESRHIEKLKLAAFIFLFGKQYCFFDTLERDCLQARAPLKLLETLCACADLT